VEVLPLARPHHQDGLFHTIDIELRDRWRWHKYMPDRTMSLFLSSTLTVFPSTIFSVNVPSDYGYVVLAVGVGSFIVPTLMGGAVMKARKEFDVQYPNLYATPGYHKKADEFNRIQRGHQNMFESLSSVSIMTLLGGIQYPRINAGGYVLYLLGSHFYLKGYADTTLDVKMARYQRGGGIKWIGVLCSLVSTVSLGGSMLGWW
jgi:glutathione S-transferase